VISQSLGLDAPVQRSNPVPPMNVGRSVVALRAIFGVSAERLASAASISSYSLSRLENGHRRPSDGEIGRLVMAVGRLVDQTQSA
jgi:transcriptional regulator with XRE-family HTH domain